MATPLQFIRLFERGLDSMRAEQAAILGIQSINYGLEPPPRTISDGSFYGGDFPIVLNLISRFNLYNTEFTISVREQVGLEAHDEIWQLGSCWLHLDLIASIFVF